MMQRLQKILATAGIASRRQAEEFIQQGRVSVNGVVVTELGTKADPEHDRIAFDGRPITAAAPPRYLALHKPPGYITTVHDPQGRPTVVDLLSTAEGRHRLFPVGRLDRETEGLLLLTNDGELAYRLTHPKHEVAKEYLAGVVGRPSEADLSRIRRGLKLDDEQFSPAEVDIIRPAAATAPAGGPRSRTPGRRSLGRTAPTGPQASPAAGESLIWLRFVIHEGRKRQIRRMAEAIGHPVERLIRVRIGPLQLGRLPQGHSRELTPAELNALRRAVGLDAPPSPR